MIRYHPPFPHYYDVCFITFMTSLKQIMLRKMLTKSLDCERSRLPWLVKNRNFLWKSEMPPPLLPHWWSNRKVDESTWRFPNVVLVNFDFFFNIDHTAAAQKRRWLKRHEGSREACKALLSWLALGCRDEHKGSNAVRHFIALRQSSSSASRIHQSLLVPRCYQM